ncbi:MAG: glycine--tRNA ligase subunit beta [Elusimicrobia bacterium]|nr:glycine--tRNA ligase subunit beta [Elusimicrobiota bacterium]
MKKEAPSKDALLEIGMEEMPARFMPDTLAQLEMLASNALKEAGLPHAGIETWGTPRRLALLVKALAPRSADRTDVAIGPPPKAAKDPSGAWTAAATGFAKAQKIPVDKLVLQQTPKGERYVALHDIKGQKTEQVLKDIFPAVIRGLAFPKSMIWESPEFRFARPLRWIVALYNGNVVRFKLNGINSDRTTVGLLSLGGRKIAISRPDKYKSLLQGRCILVDPEERRKNIRGQIESISKRLRASAIVDAAHLDEVANLTEYPVSILGHFPERYLKLPREVLVTVLKKHQKFFPIESANGQLTNAFVGVRNGPSESQEAVREGYERVTNARFADAEFFFEKDSQTRLDSLVEKLKGVGFHEKLGSMHDKTQRVREFARVLAGKLKLGEETAQVAERIALLSKADLLTLMVGELPELQGIAGRFYAMSQEKQEVAHGVEQHYWPITTESPLPASEAAAVVAIADKMDTLAANFSVGLIPSGSADPYGLRRAAVGVIRILNERRWNISLSELTTMAYGVLGPEKKGAKELMDFFHQRFAGWFENKGFRSDEIDAVLSANNASIAVMQEKLQGLKAVRGRPEFDSLANAIKRARNILAQARERGVLPDGDLSPNEIAGGPERALLDALVAIRGRFHAALDRRDYQAALLDLATLKTPIDAFFEGVMVMVDDANLRSQRLRLLLQVKQLFDALADFSKLQVSAPVAG